MQRDRPSGKASFTDDAMVGTYGKFRTVRSERKRLVCHVGSGDNSMEIELQFENSHTLGYKIRGIYLAR